MILFFKHKLKLFQKIQKQLVCVVSFSIDHYE